MGWMAVVVRFLRYGRNDDGEFNPPSRPKGTRLPGKEGGLLAPGVGVMLRASEADLPDDWREQVAAAIALCSGRRRTTCQMTGVSKSRVAIYPPAPRGHPPPEGGGGVQGATKRGVMASFAG